jgi:antibiotic biosynthesis monooxygenase (ABM) superfamily enzyme
MDVNEFQTAILRRAEENESSANKEPWQQIGHRLNSTDENWAADGPTAAQFHERLVAYAEVQDLVAELAAGIDSTADYTAWLTNALIAVRFSAPDRFTAAEYDENYGMNYRFDTLYEIYEWEDPNDSGRWMDSDEADRMRLSLVESGTGATDYSEAAYDENYQMWYRYDNANGVYEWADTADAGPDEWLSQAEVDARYAELAPDDVHAADETVEPAEVVELSAAVELSEADQQFVDEFSDEIEPILAEAFKAVPEAQDLTDDEIRQVLESVLGADS